jgi:hypothetical protein
MAYGAVVTWKQSLIPGGAGRRVNIHVVETDAAAGTAWSTLDNGTTNQVNELASDGSTAARSLPLPPLSVLRQLKVSRESGTAATVTPRLGKPATPGTFTAATKDVVAQVAAAAAFVFEAPDTPIAFAPNHVGARYLSGMSIVDAGADNVLHTHIVLDEVY